GGPLHDDAQISVGSRIKYHHRHVNGVAIRLRTIESKTAPQPLRSFLSHIAAMTREPMVVNAPQANGTTPPRLVFFAEAPPVSGLGGAQGALFREAIVNAFQEAASRLTAEALTNVQAWRLAAAFVFQDHARAGQLVLDKPDHDNLAAALGDSLKKNGVFEFHRSRISMAEEMKIYGTRAGVLVVMEPLDGQNLDKTKPIDWPALLAKFQAIAAPSDVAAPRVPRMAAPPAVQLFQPKAA
ncbi:MAG: hypothetical protein EB121_06800, partial [Alphaproteobacteria bacterium]|nr:hypothetical protein [Alphaproteobacteria bacterium]